jgi:hemolysin III
MQEQSGWLLLAVVWGLAFVGSGFKVFYTGRFELLSTATYMGFGWLALFFLEPILQQVPRPAVVWLLSGGLAYTFGVIFYVSSRPYTHATWHVCVLVGSSCHYVAVRYALAIPGAA